MRFRLLLVLAGAVLVALTYTFPLWQTLLESNEAAPEEVFPGLPDTLRDSFMILPPDQQQAYRDIAAQDQARALAMLTAALSAPIPAPGAETELPAMNAPVTIATGVFERLDSIRWGQGDVTLYQQADNSKLLRFENFSVANGPDLRVVLSTNAAPQTVEEMRERELDIDLGGLKGTNGNQHYEVPAELDIADYNSVVLYSASLELIYSIARFT